MDTEIEPTSRRMRGSEAYGRPVDSAFIKSDTRTRRRRVVGADVWRKDSPGTLFEIHQLGHDDQAPSNEMAPYPVETAPSMIMRMRVEIILGRCRS